MIAALQTDHDRAAAVDNDRLACHETRGWRGQKDGRAGNLMGFTDASHRSAAVDLLQSRRVIPQRTSEVGTDQAGSDAIHPDAFAAELDGKSSRQLKVGGLDWDESLYIVMAQRWLQGDLPYVRIWDQHP